LIDDKFKIFCGSANPRLAEDICRHLGTKLGEAKLGKFSDGEVYFQVLENVRGADVFVVQPCSNPADFHLMELLMMMDAFKRASAWRITAVVPYYCYARQDRKDKPRVPISAKLVADLMETAGANRALTLDLHAPQIQGYFNVPVDHLYASPVLIEYFEKKKIGNLTVVSPDAGGVERARAFAKKLDAPLAIVDKRRVDIDVSEVMHLIGDVRGRATLIVDDIIDTAGTLVKTAEALLKEGAESLRCLHASGAFRAGRGPHLRVANRGSHCHGFRASDRDGEKSFKDQGAERRRAARPRHSFDSRRDLDQRTVFLTARAACAEGLLWPASSEAGIFGLANKNHRL